MNQVQLGKIPTEVLKPIKEAITPLVLERPLTYRVLNMGDEVTRQFYKILFSSDFIDTHLTMMNTKLFVTPPYQRCGYIHKDGIDKKCALNVVLDCNLTDWVRWYSDDEIEKHGGIVWTGEDAGWPGHLPNTPTTSWGVRRVTNLHDVGVLDHVEEMTNQQPGDFYLINTDVFHTFKNLGNRYRLIIQTKFDQNDSIEEVYSNIKTGVNF